jgi:uncharacterized RDD family membrane protein YckC
MEEQQNVDAANEPQAVEVNPSDQMQQIISSAENIEDSTVEAAQSSIKAVEYAGFWVRFAAVLVDGLVLIVPSIIVNVIFGKSLGVFMQYVLGWTYAIYMLNTRQATLGKMAVGLKVTTIDGGMPTTGKLALREILGKILDVVTLGIGYLMIVFTAKKQGLHDMIADTVVVYDPARKRRGWLVVMGIVFALIIPIMGILAGVILVSTNSAKNKAQDISVKASISALMPSAIIYGDDNGTFKGFKPDVSFKLIACSGQPVINISSDGKNIAIFAKSCSDSKIYFCDDKNGLVNVTADYAQTGSASCR